MIEKNIIQRIIASVVLIAFGKQTRLYLGDLSAYLHLDQTQHYFQQQSAIKESTHIDTGVTVREFVRMSFAEIGIEVEFCGRGELEKGVIIDIDEERLNWFGIDKDYIKFGQTVVKIEDQFCAFRAEKLSFENVITEQDIHCYRSDFDLEKNVKYFIMNELGVLKK